MQPLIEEVEDQVLNLILNRPKSHNAMSQEMLDDLLEALEELENNDNIRCVVIKGAGDSFCSGGDVNRQKERFEKLQENNNEPDMTVVTKGQELILRLHQLSIPTVACVKGAAIGAGANIAMACDIALSTKNAKFGWTFSKLGLSPDSGGSFYLPTIVGAKKAKELLYTGKIISGEEAANLGLVNHAWPSDQFDEQAGEMIETISNGPPIALKITKQLANMSHHHGIEDALDKELNGIETTYTTKDHYEGARAFFDNEQPEFVGE